MIAMDCHVANLNLLHQAISFISPWTKLVVTLESIYLNEYYGLLE